VKCVDFILAVLYIILICVFLGWGLYHRIRERKPTYRTKSVSNVISDGALYTRNREKDENLPMQIHVSMLLFNLSMFVFPFFFQLKRKSFVSFPYACFSNSDFVLTDLDYKMMEDARENRNEVRLSAVQGYMSNFYRLLPMLQHISSEVDCHLTSLLQIGNMDRM